MSLKEMCVHCLDIKQVPRPEKKMSRQNATAIIIIQFSNPWEKKMVSYLGEL